MLAHIHIYHSSLVILQVLLKHLKKKRKSDQQMMINDGDRVGNTALHEASYHG